MNSGTNLYKILRLLNSRDFRPKPFSGHGSRTRTGTDDFLDEDEFTAVNFYFLVAFMIMICFIIIFFSDYPKHSSPG